MYRQWVLKTPRNQWKCWCIRDVKPWRNFQRILQLLKNIILTLMLWKRTNLTRCIVSVSVWRGPSHRPSIAYLRRDCSPKGTHVIPREWYASSLCPQISEKWKIRRFLFIPSPIFIYAGSEIFIHINFISRIKLYSYVVYMYFRI